MKQLHFLLALLITIAYGTIARAQLIIDSINLPNQGVLNQTVEVQAVVRNEHIGPRTGNLKFYLINQSHPELGIFEFASFSQLQFFAPHQSRTFNFSFLLSEQYFRTGGNTVVIWPSMVGQPGDSSKIVREIYIDEVSVTGNFDQLHDSFTLYPNPSASCLYIKASTIYSLKYEIYSLDGKLIKSGEYNQQGIDLEGLGKGVYYVHIKAGNASFPTIRRFIKE